MTDLITWLRARLDEDERVAKAALDLKHRGEWVWRKDSRTTVLDADGNPIQSDPARVERGPHIAKWHPARVLAEVEAKRRILDEHKPWNLGASDYFHCGVCMRLKPTGDTGKVDWRFIEAPCLTLRLLALPYASHPDYDPTWRP